MTAERAQHFERLVIGGLLAAFVVVGAMLVALVIQWFVEIGLQRVAAGAGVGVAFLLVAYVVGTIADARGWLDA